jgi:DNA-binding response OmpR family regulator
VNEEKKIHTLIVDDEERIRFFLKETLRRVGHTVETASDGDEALDILRDTAFDLAMLDLKLGGRTDGLDVLKAIRWRWPDTAVIILTAHGSLKSAMSAIRDGIDGYILKPTEPDEVRQVVREALERRQNFNRAQEEPEGHILQQGSFFIDLDKHLVTYKGERLDLTAQEFKLLAFMIENNHRVLSPPELVREVRDYEPDSLHEARQIIKWYIHRLRQKVEPKPSKPCYIINVRGVGYRFKIIEEA